ERLRQVHAVALAARERLHELLLVAALEVEEADVGPGADLVLADADGVLAAGDLGPHRLFAVERLAGLVHVHEPDRLADLDRAGVRLLLPGDDAEERGLAGAVRADDADDRAARNAEVEPFVEQLVAVRLRQALGLDHLLAEAFERGRDGDFVRVAALL